MEKMEHKAVATNGINMHVATIDDGPVILFLNGFPELWYSWRHQLLTLSFRGYCCIAPDLRGYGDTDAPESVSEYTALHIVGDLVGLLDALEIQEPVFLVGHDWGALIAWYLCMFRPDRIKALVNTSVRFLPRHPQVPFVDGFRAKLGDDFYIRRFQEPGEVEEDFAHVETGKLMVKFLTMRDPKPPMIPKGRGFSTFLEPSSLPSWLTQKDIDYYAAKFNKTGFTRGLNYYRAFNQTWKLTGAWTGAKIDVPVKFIIGDLDLVYHLPGMKELIRDMKRQVPLLQEVVVMEGVSHFLNQEKADEISNHIYDFVKVF